MWHIHSATVKWDELKTYMDYEIEGIRP